ncbi:MAG: GGDEF domain-containing protein [Lachnospiraceae bacterium]|nr:GGDEF domain-containing protein [Lachnospiraceae bacterium]
MKGVLGTNYDEDFLFEEKSEILRAAFKSMLENTKDMMFLKDANLKYVAASPPFVKMVGKDSLDEIINRTDAEIFADEGLAERYVTDDHKLLDGGKNLINYIEPITDENGHHRYGTTSKYILRNKEGKVLGILGFTRDITRDYIARQQYQQELSYLFELPKDIYAVSYIDVDSWRIISQRRQLIDDNSLQSCLSVETLCEAALKSIVDKNSEAAEFYRNFTPTALHDIYASGRSRLSLKYLRRLTNGAMRWVHNEIRFLMDVDSGHLCAMLSAKDIDAKKKEEQKLAVAAKLDRMTMLLNRETTMELIRKILCEESENKHALFMIDADNFKALNDTQGHQTGDEFLIALAKEIQSNFREDDVVGRIGGDEFFALMRNVFDKDAVSHKAEELLSAIQDVCADYATVPLSASIGIGLYPDSAKNMDELYSSADDALYQAKRAGKNQFAFSKRKTEDG